MVVRDDIEANSKGKAETDKVKNQEIFYLYVRYDEYFSSFSDIVM